MRKTPAHNTLSYGDSLAIMREHVEDESIDSKTTQAKILILS
jgi:hypothetical protein